MYYVLGHFFLFLSIGIFSGSFTWFSIFSSRFGKFPSVIQKIFCVFAIVIFSCVHNSMCRSCHVPGISNFVFLFLFKYTSYLYWVIQFLSLPYLFLCFLHDPFSCYALHWAFIWVINSIILVWVFFGHSLSLSILSHFIILFMLITFVFICVFF